MYVNLEASNWRLGDPNQKRWVIEKETRLVCFGNPGYVDQWNYWDSYETREEAESALEKLNSRRDPTKRERYQITDRGNIRWVQK